MKRILLIVLLMFSTQFIFAQRNICGKVTNQSNGKALVGASVVLKGTIIGVVTDIEGKYCLEIPESEKKRDLVFSYVGFTNQTVKITDKNTVNIKMSELFLDEIIAITYGNSIKKDKTREKKSPKSKKETLRIAPPPPPPPPPPTTKKISTGGSVAGVARVTSGDFKAASKRDVGASMSEIPVPKPMSEEVDGFFDIAPESEEFMMMSFDEDFSESAYEPEVRSGLLTAGEINDFSKWTMWQDIAENELNNYQKQWSFFAKNRYTVQVSTENGKPIVDAEVRLMTSKNNVYWRAKTDNTGKAELWLQMFEDVAVNTNNLKIEVVYKRKKETLKNPRIFKEGINFITMNTRCNVSQNADVLFVVDATSSMADEINYLKAELKDVIQEAQKQRSDLEIRLGSVFYRDHGDEYVTRKSDFSPRIEQTIEFLQKNRAMGGGDYEEAVEDALEVAINEMKWSESAVARLLFLVLDAPPHQTPETKRKLQQLSAKAAEKGIRIIPVGASGINKSAEYLMRSLALASNGTYTFLTDHSGIGGSHIKPSTDDYDMEFLNDLLVRLIDELTQTPECTEDTELVEAAKAEVLSEEVLQTLNFYPNPVVDELTIDLKVEVSSLFITDLSGKILQRLEKLQEGKLSVDMSRYPSGIYFVRYTTLEGKEGSAKLVVI